MSSGQDPGAADQRTTAPGAGQSTQLQGKSHLVGELADGGVASSGDATSNVANDGHLAAAMAQLRLGKAEAATARARMIRNFILGIVACSVKGTQLFGQGPAGVFYTGQVASAIGLQFRNRAVPIR